MQKLRDLYAETQNNARNNFDKVTLQRCKKIMAYVNREYENTNAQNDIQSFLEITFYQEKFKLVIDRLNLAINQKSKKSKLQADILQILQENYRPQLGQPDNFNTPQPFHQPPHSPNSPPPKIEQTTEKPKHRLSREDEKLLKSSSDPKDMINSYFDMKKVEIEKSKVGFKSVLENIPKVNHKYAVKHNPPDSKQKQANDENISKLTKQIDELSKNLQNSKVSSEFNYGLIQLQKQKYETRLKQLRHELDKLHRENQRLRQEEQLHARPQEKPHPQPVVERVFVYEQKQENSVYDPYNISYRSNDLNRLTNQHLGHPSPNEMTHHLNHHHQPSSAPNSHLLPQNALNHQANHNRPSQHSGIKIVHKKSQEDILEKIFPEKHMHQAVRSQSGFEKSNLRFNKSELENQQRNIIIRSKLSFFKPSMVLYRGQDFELAIRSADLLPLQSRKIAIYINNKDRFDRPAHITYSCDPHYYDIKTAKKLTTVEGMKQGKQEIEVRLKNHVDLDSLVEAKLEINNRTLKFIIPTMMIQFLDDRPQHPKAMNYEKNVVSSPMFQFLTVYSAMEMMPLERDYEDRVEVGSVYARSKYYEGYVLLRWKGRHQLQIETIKPWLLFLSYLIVKDY